MFNDIKDISGEDFEAFKHLEFIKIGCTGDGNNYLLLMGVETGYRGVTVAVPVDDYQAMVKHLDIIDEQLSRLEDSIDGKMGVDEKLNSVIPYPLNKVNYSLRGYDGESQQVYMNRLSGLKITGGSIHKVAFVGKDNPLIKILDDAKYQWMEKDMIKVVMPDEIDFDVAISDGVVTIQTYLHTILYGKHREQRCTYTYSIGERPSPLVEPSSITIVDMEESEIKEYINRVRDWKKRDEEIKAWSDYKDKVIRDAKETIRREISVYVSRQEMVVPKLGSHDILQGYDIIKINPFVFWISPDESVPDGYRDILRGDESEDITL